MDTVKSVFDQFASTCVDASFYGLHSTLLVYNMVFGILHLEVPLSIRADLSYSLVYIDDLKGKMINRHFRRLTNSLSMKSGISL